MNKFNNALTKPEMKYFNLINSLLDVVVELDVEFFTTYINPQVYELFGYSPEELVGEKNIDMIHPDDISLVMNAFRKTVKTGEAISEEFRIRHKDGYYIPVSARGCKVEDNNQVKIVAIFRDISKEKESQTELSESDKRYHEVIENLEDGYFETNLKGNFTYVNRYICRYLGIPREQLLGKSYTIVLEEATKKEVFDKFSNVYTRNLPKETFESQVIRNDGQKRIFEGSFYLKYDLKGNKIGFYGFTRDITKKKIAEKKIQDSEKKYREAYNRAELYKDLFYHDINNILSNITFSIDLSEKYLNESVKEKEIKDIYDIIRKQFAKGKILISNVQKLSQLENSEIVLKSINATPILKKAIDFIKNSGSTKHIKIAIDSFEDEVLIKVDEFLIDIFDNILINAVRYNENPQVEILIKISKNIKKNINYIQFEFEDNGIGIADEKKKIIFHEGFNKEKGSKGMGFGLTLVKKIIESYSGQIWVEDRVKGDFSKGSNFLLLLPEDA